jgi:hypothetical protein
VFCSFGFVFLFFFCLGEDLICLFTCLGVSLSVGITSGGAETGRRIGRNSLWRKRC